MNDLEVKNVANIFEAIYEELCALESLVLFTQEVCLKKEISSYYYNLDNNEKKKLSEERNHYINMLSLANEKINLIKHHYSNFENGSINYNNIPTIAADK